MITFSPLRTPRLQVNLRELTARDAIALCQIPAEHTERGTTELLNAIVVASESPRVGEVTDHRLWSVQERALVVFHYMAHVLGGDFQIGESGKYSDYLIADGIGAPPAPVVAGEVAGRRWMLQPLLGWHAESIERLIEAEELTADYTGWLIGALAAQLYAEDEGPLAGHDATDALIDKALTARAEALTALAESDFMLLVRAHRERQHEIDHTFRLAIGEKGVMFLPDKEVPGLPPARFPFTMAIREDTAAVFGQPA